MSSEPFGATYAAAYDRLYHDKDYIAECDLIERVLGTYRHSPVRSILDLGCGTGNHAIPLARRGYEVGGVDRSESMVAEAIRKAAAEMVVVPFSQGDVRTVRLHRLFDAVVMMFAVLGYQVSDEDVLGALKTARRHLRDGGLFLVEVWHGPAVLHQPPQGRVKTVSTPQGELRRESMIEVDRERHLAAVHFRLSTPQGTVVTSEELHRLRYFFPEELHEFLQKTGFECLRVGAFPDFDRDPDESSWNVLAVGRAIPGAAIL
jgi:SAM-dependent methyltransferase